jgi:hypothetical protein
MLVDADQVVVVVTRNGVESRDISSVVKVLNSCLSSSERALSFFERLYVAFFMGIMTMRGRFSKSRRYVNMCASWMRSFRTGYSS